MWADLSGSTHIRCRVVVRTGRGCDLYLRGRVSRCAHGSWLDMLISSEGLAGTCFDDLARCVSAD